MGWSRVISVSRRCIPWHTAPTDCLLFIACPLLFAVVLVSIIVRAIKGLQLAR